MNFGVTPEQLIEISKHLGNVSNEFLNEVAKMYNTLDDLNAKWEGTGSSGYYNAINSHKEDVKAIGTVIGQYSEFLGKASNTYNATDSEVAGNASRL